MDPILVDQAAAGASGALGDSGLITLLAVSVAVNGAPLWAVLTLIVVAAIGSIGVGVVQRQRRDALDAAVVAVDDVLAAVRDWYEAPAPQRLQVAQSWAADPQRMTRILDVGRTVNGYTRLSRLIAAATGQEAPDYDGDARDNTRRLAHEARALYSAVHYVSGGLLTDPPPVGADVLRAALVRRGVHGEG